MFSDGDNLRQPSFNMNEIGYDYFYCLKPIKNPILTLIDDLRNYRVNLKDL
jgi:hypothetical protein